MRASLYATAGGIEVPQAGVLQVMQLMKAATACGDLVMQRLRGMRLDKWHAVQAVLWQDVFLFEAVTTRDCVLKM
jgi:hypothetical protein